MIKWNLEFKSSKIIGIKTHNFIQKMDFHNGQPLIVKEQAENKVKIREISKI